MHDSGRRKIPDCLAFNPVISAEQHPLNQGGVRIRHRFLQFRPHLQPPARQPGRQRFRSVVADHAKIARRHGHPGIQAANGQGRFKINLPRIMIGVKAPDNACRRDGIASFPRKGRLLPGYRQTQSALQWSQSVAVSAVHHSVGVNIDPNFPLPRISAHKLRHFPDCAMNRNVPAGIFPDRTGDRSIDVRHAGHPGQTE